MLDPGSQECSEGFAAVEDGYPAVLCSLDSIWLGWMRLNLSCWILVEGDDGLYLVSLAPFGS